MQKAHLDYKNKFQILAVITGIVIVTGITLFLPHFFHGHGFHTIVHLGSIALGSFLSIIGFLTYIEYKTTRLLLVFFAFLTVTIAEILSAFNMILLFWPSYTSIDSMITHLLILMMLSFFSVGIFRRD